jgi:hypothetical protein
MRAAKSQTVLRQALDAGYKLDGHEAARSIFINRMGRKKVGAEMDCHGHLSLVVRFGG